MEATNETQSTPKTTKERIAAPRARLAKLRTRLAARRGSCDDCGKTLKAPTPEAYEERKARHVRNCPQRVR